MNLKRMSVFALSVGMLLVTFGLATRASIQRSINTCVTGNNVDAVLHPGLPMRVCDSMTKAWLILGMGGGVLLISMFLIVGLTKRTRGWGLIWAAILVWAAGTGIVYL